MNNLVYDLNNDNKITTADVVYFASSLIDKDNYNMNFNQQLVSVDGLLLQKVFNRLPSNTNIKLDNNNQSYIEQFTTTLLTYSKNSSFLYNINLCYLTSLFADTYIKIELYYDISGVVNKFAEAKLGTLNTSFLQSSYNYNTIIDINSEINEIITFKLRAYYINENGLTLENNYKPEIILDLIGNNVSIIEIKNP